MGLLWGFASRKGDPVSNQRLSEDRCLAVKAELNMYANQVNYNINKALGEASSGGGETDNWGFYRRVEIYVFAAKPPLGFKPVPPPPKPKRPSNPFKGMKAPLGCWLIVGVDAFGLPIKAGISAGTVDVTLLNDKGEVYVISGAGVGVGLGVDIAPTEWAKRSGKAVTVIIEALKEIGLKAGDLQNVFEDLKKLNLTGPSQTSGAIFKRTVWKANLTIEDITRSGYFTIVSGETQIAISGGEVGFIFFGDPPITPIVDGYEYTLKGSPWGFFTGMGVGTLKGGIGITQTVYKTTKVEKKQ